MSGNMAKIRLTALYFRIILSLKVRTLGFANALFRVRQLSAAFALLWLKCGNGHNLATIGQYDRTFCPEWVKSAKPKVTFANAKYANANPCERSVRSLLVKYTNAYRSISGVLRTLQEFFCSARLFFKLCYKVRRCKRER